MINNIKTVKYLKNKNPKPNPKLIKALKESDKIENSKIKVNSYNNRLDLKKALLSDD